MDELITIIDENRGESRAKKTRALPQFSYQNGYLLSVIDLGKHGVKIELRHQADAEDQAAFYLTLRAYPQANFN